MFCNPTWYMQSLRHWSCARMGARDFSMCKDYSPRCRHIRLWQCCGYHDRKDVGHRATQGDSPLSQLSQHLMRSIVIFITPCLDIGTVVAAKPQKCLSPWPCRSWELFLWAGQVFPSVKDISSAAPRLFGANLAHVITHAQIAFKTLLLPFAGRSHVMAFASLIMSQLHSPLSMPKLWFGTGPLLTNEKLFKLCGWPSICHVEQSKGCTRHCHTLWAL